MSFEQQCLARFGTEWRAVEPVDGVLPLPAGADALAITVPPVGAGIGDRVTYAPPGVGFLIGGGA